MTVTLTREQRVAAYLAIARLLAYPDQAATAEVPMLRRLSRDLPDIVGKPLLQFLDLTADRPLLELQSEYVATFDLKRRCCLYLSYFLNGDTRRRGMALWRFKETYRLAGWSVEGGELPDYLPVLLEFAASGPDEESAALAILHEHREGLEVLRAALERFAAPQQLVIQALITTLPELTDVQLLAAQELVAAGPPTETVGLEPFGSELLTIGARP
ncbi:MAG: nitrate reductase molybdenum cofactor assembly chaperone [Candidatus Nanopelagicales bacterium]|nr:nitrate reductase molybdenum cofactor assembly chaperone [Candidatus Nanopelagicales bacterium]